jgi:hypothetical protein
VTRQKGAEYKDLKTISTYMDVYGCIWKDIGV